MQVQAVAKYIRVQPRKVRIVADEVNGKPAAQCVAELRYHTSKSAQALRKVLISAMANARENHGVDPENLRIARIMVDEGPSMKRMMPRAMGRGNRILKKTSHITVIVEEFEPAGAVKPHGTKSKPRPTFAAPKKGKKKAEEKAEEVVEAAAPVVEEVVETPAVEEVVEAAPEETPAEPETVAEAPAEEPAAEANEEEKGA
ncbi:MAG: 50S ribosomal protein L22 [Methanoregulaceae archaeon]|nr:50S ribosomal protein L22 [Methanoregulaceae archaeon]